MKKYIGFIILSLVLLLSGCSFLNTKAYVSKGALQTYSSAQMEVINEGTLNVYVPDSLLKNDLEKQLVSTNNNIPYHMDFSFKKNNNIEYKSNIDFLLSEQGYTFGSYLFNDQLFVSNGEGWLQIDNEQYAYTLNKLSNEKAIEERLFLHIFENLDKKWFSKKTERIIEVKDNQYHTNIVSLDMSNEEVYSFLEELSLNIGKDNNLVEILTNQDTLSAEEEQQFILNLQNKIKKWKTSNQFETFKIDFYIDSEGYLRLVQYDIKLSPKSNLNEDYLSFTLKGNAFFNEMTNDKYSIKRPKFDNIYNNIYDFLIELILKQT